MNKPGNKHILAAVTLIILAALGTAAASIQLKNKPELATVPLSRSDVTKGVSNDGTVKAAQDLGLAFEQGGTVSKINVKAGDRVKKGQILVELDSRGLSAALSQAQAAVQASQANYEKLSNGATDQDIAVAQVALNNAKTGLDNTVKQQQVIVDSAYRTLLNAGLSAVPGSGNIGSVTATITGTYTGQDQGSYKIIIYTTGSGLRFQYEGLENGSGTVDITPQPMGSKGLYIQFSSTAVPANNAWTVSIPNTQSASFTANNNAYQSALQNQKTAVDAAQSAVNSAQAALDLKTTKARPEDLAAGSAQLSASRAQYQLAQNSYSHSQLTAPIDGIITSVDTKVGQTVAGSTLAPGLPVIKMISDQKFQAETYVAENEIGKIKTGDAAQITLDAYGNGTIFGASVAEIDPAATVIKGISTYKVTLQFDKDDERIRSGMGASIVIIDEVRENTLAVPKTSLLAENGKSYLLIKNSDGTLRKTEVQTGVYGVEGKVEILSGATEGQPVVTFGD